LPRPYIFARVAKGIPRKRELKLFHGVLERDEIIDVAKGIPRKRELKRNILEASTLVYGLCCKRNPEEKGTETRYCEDNRGQTRGQVAKGIPRKRELKL